MTYFSSNPLLHLDSSAHAPLLQEAGPAKKIGKWLHSEQHHLFFPGPTAELDLNDLIFFPHIFVPEHPDDKDTILSRMLCSILFASFSFFTCNTDASSWLPLFIPFHEQHINLTNPSCKLPQCWPWIYIYQSYVPSYLIYFRA